MNQPVTRRLAAILAADVAGYSAMMGADEEGTLAGLRALRKELVDPAIAAHRGRIVKTTGDGLLAEFASVIDAMRCAVEIQRAMVGREAAGKRIEFRIGVNLGDIIFEDGDIYGDGVNIAARLEQLAQPGGVCISHTVYKECRTKIDENFADGGDVALKNIAKPVHVWHWRPEAVAVKTVEPAETRPSIAVLPFVNMSSDPEKEYFADGITEDIITGLSFDSRLFVISRNSTFVYKGKPVDSRTMGKELGVRYLVEGSIRPVGDQLRITVQLIDTANGTHVWADRIDRPMTEIFAISDEVVNGLVTALGSNLSVAEGKRASRQRPEDLQAWALVVRAETDFFSSQGPEPLVRAEKLLRRAAEIEPGYAASWAFLAYLTGLRVLMGISADAAKDSDEALVLANKAMRLAPQDSAVLGFCAWAYMQGGQNAQAIDCAEHSLQLNPGNGMAQVAYGEALLFDGRPGEAIKQLDYFLRLSPKDPLAYFAYFFRAYCYLALNDFHQAEESARKALRLSPGFATAYLPLAFALAGSGRIDEARQQIQKLREILPGLTRKDMEDFYQRSQTPRNAKGVIAALRRVWPD